MPSARSLCQQQIALACAQGVRTSDLESLSVLTSSRSMTMANHRELIRHSATEIDNCRGLMSQMSADDVRVAMAGVP